MIGGAVFLFIFVLVAAEQLQNPIDDGNALTFTWYDGVLPVNVTIDDADRSSTNYLAGRNELYDDLNGTVKLGATNFSSEFPNSIAWTRTAGFVETVFYGYQQHHNVILRPDDIWTAILVQFSLYVNANAKELRHSFVNFEDKKPLVVSFRKRVDQVDIREFISQISNLTRENINEIIYDWIMPSFSTTTENDKLTAGVAMMATLQEYFDYELWSIICGIPKATILGTVDDWIEIRKRVEKLKEFEVEGKNIMAQWSSMLERILDEFVSVKSGNKPTEKFWKDAIREDYLIIDLVCAKINETKLNGWITTFSAFSLAGKWRGEDMIENVTSVPWLKVRAKSLTPGMVHVPIKIYDEFAEVGERNYTGAILTGHVGYSVKRDGNTIQPFSGWMMMITNDPPQYLRTKNCYGWMLKLKI